MTVAAAKATRVRVAYECDVCGHPSPKWVGRCPECGEWGSVVERARPAVADGPGRAPAARS
ncbi:MAG: DNA repair protein RadA, partial [Natronosporangium sp.]